jgi:tetratricopeptide (TPR) repeat protein
MRLSVIGFGVLLIAGALPALPGDLEDAYKNLKEAEAKKDPAQVKKLAGETCALARRDASLPAPVDDDEKEEWKNHVAYARDVETYTEYALFVAAIQAPPAAAADLLAALEQQNPKSKYLEDAYGRYFLALNQMGEASKIPAVAETALANFPDNEDLLLVLADSAMSNRQSDRALDYAGRLVAVLNNHAKPEGMSDSDWEAKRSAALGRGYWISGMVRSERSQFFEADRDLRAALPLIKGNDAMLAPALFSLGVANYQLGKTAKNKAQVLEGAKFSEQAAAIKSPLAAQASTNARAMRAEALKMR